VVPAASRGPGHQIPDVETVIEERGDYLVIRKDPGLPADFAEATDPRSA